MEKLVLFDIDGTILMTAGVGRRAIRRALLEAMGLAGPIDGVRFDGKTDPQIVRELLEAADHPDADDPECVWEVCRQYVRLLEAELAGADGSVRVLDGVGELLRVLEGRADTLIGLLTGNMERGAQLKLTSAGLDPARFAVGAFGSDAVERRELPAFASRRAKPLMGRAPSGNAMVIIGDTPSDVTCGASLGARAIGVATGSYSVAELQDAGAYAAFPDLTDTVAVTDAIFA
jgi:phosphoglycolate phosphatase-like HAD superfamily hydrolase